MGFESLREYHISSYNIFVQTFQISTRETGRYRSIQVHVYDSVERMRTAGERYRTKYGMGGKGTVSQAHGLTFTHVREYFYPSGATRRHPDAGHILLYEDGLKIGIISHEATHMAWSIYQQDVQRTIPDMEREEKLCYLVGDITRQIVNKLLRTGKVPEAD